MSPLLRRQAGYGVAYITPGMLILLVFCIAPIFMTLYYSFTEYNLAQPPEWLGLENYEKVFTNSQLRRAVINTVIYVIITVPLQTLLAMFVANFLAEYLNNRYGRFLRSIIFIPTLASYVAAATVWKVILASRGGLLNEVLGIFGIGPINWLGEPTLALICVSLVAVWKSAQLFNYALDTRYVVALGDDKRAERFPIVLAQYANAFAVLGALGEVVSDHYALTGGRIVRVHVQIVVPEAEVLFLALYHGVPATEENSGRPSGSHAYIRTGTVVVPAEALPAFKSLVW